MKLLKNHKVSNTYISTADTLPRTHLSVILTFVLCNTPVTPVNIVNTPGAAREKKQQYKLEQS